MWNDLLELDELGLVLLGVVVFVVELVVFGVVIVFWVFEVELEFIWLELPSKLSDMISILSDEHEMSSFFIIAELVVVWYCARILSHSLFWKLNPSNLIV